MTLRGFESFWVGWLVDLGLTACFDRLFVYIESLPRERKKEKRYDRRDKKIQPHPHILKALQVLGLLLFKVGHRESYPAPTPARTVF